MGERVADALLSNRRGAIHVWLQMVVGQAAGFLGVRLDVPRIRRAELTGIPKGRADCDLHGLGHSPQFDGQGAAPVRFSTSRESENMCGRRPLMPQTKKMPGKR